MSIPRPTTCEANYPKFHLLGFMIGGFAGSAIMKVVSAPRLLTYVAVGSLACVTVALLTSGVVPV